MALNDLKQGIGFIIGSIQDDDSLVSGRIGKVEDWYVVNGHRGKGIGVRLYKELETWFTAKGCLQVRSDTWHGNEAGIRSHARAGFLISGISFAKKL